MLVTNERDLYNFLTSDSKSAICQLKNKVEKEIMKGTFMKDRQLKHEVFGRIFKSQISDFDGIYNISIGEYHTSYNQKDIYEAIRNVSAGLPIPKTVGIKPEIVGIYNANTKIFYTDTFLPFYQIIDIKNLKSYNKGKRISSFNETDIHKYVSYYDINVNIAIESLKEARLLIPEQVRERIIEIIDFNENYFSDKIIAKAVEKEDYAYVPSLAQMFFMNDKLDNEPFDKHDYIDTIYYNDYLFSYIHDEKNTIEFLAEQYIKENEEKIAVGIIYNKKLLAQIKEFEENEKLARREKVSSILTAEDKLTSNNSRASFNLLFKKYDQEISCRIYSSKSMRSGNISPGDIASKDQEKFYSMFEPELSIGNGKNELDYIYQDKHLDFVEEISLIVYNK